MAETREAGYCKAVFMKPSAVFGYITFVDDVVEVETDDGAVITFPRDSLLILEEARKIKTEVGEINDRKRKRECEELAR